ncbi:flagellar protein FlgN [uncultured Ferrimonas sp.]|uniref:flagellar protein FlgN n=1 Tax=uncultured Ferrimonas sp. TaxID=432640 RepID=UPI0026140FBB|nr:flagellar protein FlgN [uncultured Ferrimonas sp.]
MSRADTLRTLAESIQQDLLTYPKLLAQLQKQQQLMLERDIDSLSELNQRLEQVYASLQARAAQRQQWLNELGFSSNADGFYDLLARLPSGSSAKLKQSYQRLKQLMHACQRQNDRNGQLLVKQQQLLNRLLNPHQQQQQLQDYGSQR